MGSTAAIACALWRRALAGGRGAGGSDARGGGLEQGARWWAVMLRVGRKPDETKTDDEDRAVDLEKQRGLRARVRKARPCRAVSKSVRPTRANPGRWYPREEFAEDHARRSRH